MPAELSKSLVIGMTGRRLPRRIKKWGIRVEE
jgi:hypothetical protein